MSRESTVITSNGLAGSRWPDGWSSRVAKIANPSGAGSGLWSGTFRFSAWAQIWLVLAALFLGSFPLQAQTVPAYGVFYRREAMQVGDFVFANLPGQPDYWEAWARGFKEGEVRGAWIITSAGKKLTLTPDASGASSGGLAADFSAGACTLSLKGADDTVRTVELNLPAASFPAAPKLLNLGSIVLKAGVDLHLDWQAGAGVGVGDFFLLTVQGTSLNPEMPGSWLFQTPQPGLNGALSGLVTSATVPGAMLKPGDLLQVRLTCYRVANQSTLAGGAGLAFAGAAFSVMTTLNVPDEPVNNDVAEYRLLPIRTFTQEGETPPTAPGSGGYEFEASAHAVDANRLTKVSLQPPAGSERLLELESDKVSWRATFPFASEAELLAAFPVGKYQWSFEGTAKGKQVIPQTLSPGAWPAPIAVANDAALQTSSFTNDVVVRWTSPAGARVGDQVEFAVVDAGQRVIWRYPDVASGDPVLPGTATELTIPAEELLDGEDYEARLRYIQITSQETLLEGVTGITARCVETRFAIGKLVALPLEILTTALPAATPGGEYIAQLEADGGRQPRVWSLAEGTLPPGLSLSESGLIQGTVCEGGDYAFRVQVTDRFGNSVLGLVTLATDGTLPPFAISTTSVPDVGDGLFYYFALQSAGGAPPFRWSVSAGKLPPGIELHAASGVLSGIASEAGKFSWEARLEDACGRVTHASLALNVPSVALDPRLRISLLTSAGGPIGLMSASGRVVTAAPGNMVRLHLNAEADETITLQWSADLRSWQTLFTTNNPANGILEWKHTGASAAFFRLYRGVPEPEYHPATIQITTDAASATQGLLTSAGLVLSLTNQAGVVWRLDVPAGAVTKDVAVGMAPLKSADGFPVPIGVLGGVAFTPDGLVLMAAATLTATFPNDVPPDASGFAFENDGGDFHLYPVFASGNTLTFPITHFSGVMGGRFSGGGGGGGGSGGGMTLDQACNSQSSQEQWIAMLIAQGIASRESLWLSFYEWFDQTVSPHLKNAAENDELLWLAMREFFAWSGLLKKYVFKGDDATDSISQHAATLHNKGWRQLAQAFANAVNRTHTKCVTQYRPFQAIRMMRLAAVGREHSLGQFLSDPGFFSVSRMNAKFRGAFRFELQVDSSTEFTPKKGGRFYGAVLSNKCFFEAREYTQSDDEMQNLTVCGAVPLNFVDWKLQSPGDRTRPVITAGKLMGVRLTITPNYPVSEGDPGRCTKGKTWDDPLNPEIVCVFDANDPVQKMKVKTKKQGWKIVPAELNWYTAFKLAHALQLVSENDESGAAHPSCPKITGEEEWEYLAGREFARAKYDGPPEYAENVAGQFTEKTTLTLFHAPKP